MKYMIYQNTTEKNICLQIEPWCELYTINPQQVVSIVFEDEENISKIELSQSEESFTIFGDFNNKITVFFENEKLVPRYP
jgi:hypothetical protein